MNKRMTFNEAYTKIYDKEMKDVMTHSNRMTTMDFCEKLWDYQQSHIDKLESDLSLTIKIIDGLWFENGDTIDELEARGIVFSSHELKQIKELIGRL